MTSSAHDPTRTQPEETPSVASLPAVPGYEMIAELGRGGMAVVYKARHLGLNRPVALKTILSGEYAGPMELLRLRTEAEAVASLQHPNVVQIHEVGEAGGRPYLALELVEGGTLADALDGTPWPARRAADLVRTLALATHAAHRHGIVHRDLKPANVLLTPDGTPKLTDFGLAKRLGGSDGPTASGAVLGTPSYMAPEQALGKTSLTSPVTDVYALGAVLYELLTGRPPFRAESRLDTILQVIAEEPVPPRALNPSVPRDLETVALKCLRKEPHRRYSGADDLADDLRRFLDGSPVRARPVGMGERLLKWAWRRPSAAALVAVSLAALVALIGGGLYFTNELQTALSAIQQENATAVTNERRAREEGERATREWGRAEQELDRSRRMLMTTRLVQAAALGDRDPVAARQLLYEPQACPIDLRDVTWRLLAEQLRRERLTVPLTLNECRSASLSGDGQTLATVGDQRQALLIDTRTGRERLLSKGPVGSVAFRPGTGEVFTVEGEAVRVWDAATGKPLRSVNAKTSQLNFSADGKLLATVWNQEVGVWDAAAGERLQTLAGHKEFVNGTAFSPDGALLASAGQDQTVRVWDVKSGAQKAVYDKQPGPAVAVAWVDGGRQLAVSVGDRMGRGAARVRLLDATSGEERRLLGGSPGEVWALTASPDGRTLAGGTGGVYVGGNELPGEVILWRVDSTEPPLALTGHRGGVHEVTFSADGTTLAAASGGADRLGDGLTGGSARVWYVGPTRGRAAAESDKALVKVLRALPDGQVLTASDAEVVRRDVATGDRVSAAKVIPGENRSLMTLSPDGRTAVLAGTRFLEVGVVYLRDVGEAEDRVALPKQRSEPAAAAFSPDGKVLAVGYPFGVVSFFDETGRPLRTMEATHSSGLASLAFSPDGKFLATGGSTGRTQQGEVALWEVESGRRVWVGRGHPFRVSCLAFSPDGRRLASGDRARVVMLWDVASGGSRGPLRKHAGEVASLAFSPDGETLASGGDDLNHRESFGQVILWDATTGEARLTLETSYRVNALTFSADGRALVTGGGAGAVTFWDAPDPIERAVLQAHELLVNSLQVTPIGDLLTTAGRDDTVKVWDLKTSKQRGGVGGEEGMGWSAATSPDGTLLATTTEAGTVRLWDAASREIAALQGHKGRVTQVAFAPDGTLLATAGSSDDKTSVVQIWRVATRELAFASPALAGSVQALAWTPDGGTLLTGNSDGTLRWWDVVTGSEKRAVKAHVGGVSTLAVTADGRSVYTGSRAKAIKRWDADGREAATFPTPREVYSLAVSPDGSLLAWACWDSVVRVCRAADGEPVTVLSGHDRPVACVAFTPDGRSLVSGDFGGTVRLWNVRQFRRTQP